MDESYIGLPRGTCKPKRYVLSSDSEESDAERSDAEQSDAELSDAELSDAERSDAEESDAERSDVKDSDAEEFDAEGSDAEQLNQDPLESDNEITPTAFPTNISDDESDDEPLRSGPKPTKSEIISDSESDDQIEPSFKTELSVVAESPEPCQPARDSSDDEAIGNLSRVEESKDSSVEIIDASVSIVHLSDSDERSETSQARTDTPDSVEIVETSNLEVAVKKVTRIEMIQARDILTQKRAEVMQTQALLRRMDDGKKLPDGGEQLRAKIKLKQEEAAEQERYVNSLVVFEEEENKPKPHKPSEMDWKQMEILSKGVQPHQYGAQAMSTHYHDRERTMRALKQLHDSLAVMPSATQIVDNPKGLKSQLLPHQKQALAWFLWREKHKPHCGILGDDMGLGKTLQMISLVLATKEVENDSDSSESDDDDDNGTPYQRSRDMPRGGTLIICPASVFQQWQTEVAKHCHRDALKTTLHHGAKRENLPTRLTRYDMVITTYGVAADTVLKRIRWQRVILDEAHSIRNHKTEINKAVSALTATCRWCLTGTPIHNKAEDMYGLVKFMHMKPFNDMAVFRNWLSPKLVGGTERMHLIVKSIMLRRLKTDLLALDESKFTLPMKTYEEIRIPFDAAEKRVYQKMLAFSQTLFADYLHQAAEKRQDGYNAFGVGNGNSEYYKLHKKVKRILGHHNREIKQIEILLLLLRLRQICCHLCLIKSMLDNDVDADVEADDLNQSLDIINQLQSLALEEDEPNDENVEPNEMVESMSNAAAKFLNKNDVIFNPDHKSSKIAAVMEIITEKVLKNRHDKAVIVSQWTSFLNIIGEHLKRAGIRYVEINGKVDVKRRQDIVDEFNDLSNTRRPIMLLSLTAGGVGLNLMGGNHMVMVDIHWNPMLELQAQDRIYRFGQTKPVFIYRILVDDSIEIRIQQIQERKKTLADSILTGVKNQKVNALTIDDMKSLFDFDKPLRPVKLDDTKATTKHATQVNP